MSRFHDSVRHYAELKFGKDNVPAIARWMDYWEETAARNLELLDIFRALLRIDFQGKQVLDVGCGTGGLGQFVLEEGGRYVGADFFPAVLEMAGALLRELPQARNAQLIQASAAHLPVAGASIDIAVAFDVIEHLAGGESSQVRFLEEIRRVLRPNGLLLLTTPNRLHPYDAHSSLWGTPYLPVGLADRYIRWRNPSFLQEYKTFGEIHLLTPWKMKRFLDQAGLRLVNEFPGGMALEDYPPAKRAFLKLLGKCGLGWFAPQCFWVLACRVEDWERLQKTRTRDRRRVAPRGPRPQTARAPVPEDVSYAGRLQKEIRRFKSVEDVHDLPEIFHYWSNKYLRPKLEEVLGVSTVEEFYAKYILQYRADHPGKTVEITSLGAGNSDTEIRIAKLLRDRGLADFRFRCLDINPDMLKRGRELAWQEKLADGFEFLEVDVAHWQPAGAVAAVMAHHSLHHMVNLEETFAKIRKAIGTDGYFLTWDMIGRNGHKRWPEALAVLHDIWKTMPDRYKYNHQLHRFEPRYENWDCSKVGFEGIRAQDILPLLVKDFHFEAFVAFGNLPDVFVDRGFGHNFDVQNPEDIEFIDRIAAWNDRLISEGVLKPTQIVAVLRGFSTGETRCHQHWTPQFCVRAFGTSLFWRFRRLRARTFSMAAPPHASG